MNILMAYSGKPENIADSSDFRIKIPLRAINQYTGHRAVMMHIKAHDTIRKYAQGADALIFERNFHGQNLQLIRELREAYPKKAFIATFDDGYAHLTPDIDIYELWIKGIGHGPDGSKVKFDYDPIKDFNSAIPLFDAVFVPNHELVKDFEKLAPTYFVNSFLETDAFRNAKRVREDDGKLIIGVGAGSSHFRSFRNSGVLPALNLILKKYDHVEFWIRAAGLIVDEIRRVLPPKKVVWQQRGLANGDWEALVVNFDIGLAVLDPQSKFDSRRSPIKIFEHMLARVPVVASKSATYSDYYDYGLFCENQTEWVRALSHVIENYEAHRQAYVPKAYEFACQLDIKYHVQQEYIDRIEEILRKK